MENDSGNVVVALAAVPEGVGGQGLVRVLTAKGGNLVLLNSPVHGEGYVRTYRADGDG